VTISVIKLTQPLTNRNRIDPKLIYEAVIGWLRKYGGWLAGKVWLKSAGLHHKTHR